MNNEQMTDFSAFLLSPTGVVEISLPNGEPMLYQGARVKVHVYSPASAEYARAHAALQRAALDRVRRGPKSTADDESEIDARFLCSITQSIENFPFPGGKEAVYRNRQLMYIGEQVRAYIDDKQNFFAKPSAN